jgi:glyoxylase-like metal-dependent hydrolase (beta-lactamase superfamily II)
MTEAKPGQPVDLGQGITRILAPNPSPMTGPGTNTYLVGTGTGIAVIDPGPGIPAHLDAILSFLRPGQQVSHILVTHPHADHSSLVPALVGATGALVLGFGPAGSGRSPRMRALASGADMGGGEGSDATFFPDRRLAHGDVVTGDGWQIKALHSPGHMAEHLCFAFDDQLFSGDHVMGWSTSLVSPPDGDMGAYMDSLDMLGQQVWSRFLPGHGPIIDTPAARLSELVAHRRAREAAILSALATGPQTLASVTALVYAKTPAALHPAAARNAFAHLVDLAEKGHVAATPTMMPGALFQLT